MIHARFDHQGFYQAIDTIREQRGMKWHSIWHATGVHQCALRTFRITEGQRGVSLDTLAALAIWAELDINTFFKQEESDGAA